MPSSPTTISSTAQNIMPFNDFECEELIKTLTENFSVLADEVQLLSDRKTILEHKLRYAHESVRVLLYFLSDSLTSISHYDEKLSSRSGAASCSDDRQTPCILIPDDSISNSLTSFGLIILTTYKCSVSVLSRQICSSGLRNREYFS